MHDTLFQNREAGHIISIFIEAVEEHGKEQVQEALGLIDNYIDDWYKQVMKKEHEHVRCTGRMIFAKKLLDCMGETGTERADMHNTLVDILNNEPNRGKNPLIYYATLPKVLGYWLIQQEDVGYESVHHSIYAPVEEYY